MNDLVAYCLPAIPLLPLLGAIIVALAGPKLLRENSHYPIIIAIGLSFLCSAALLLEIRKEQSAVVGTGAGYERIVPLWTWAEIPDAYTVPGETTSRDFRVDVALRADALTCMMLCMVTFVATLVAIFAAGYMHGDPGYWRFFSYVGLFVFSMTMLVSVSNFIMLFVFWEAVGVCSYLLIGFWYQKPEAAAAGKKAFLVNRVGDFGFALALFLMWTNYGTLNFHDTLSDGTVGRTEIYKTLSLRLVDRGPNITLDKAGSTLDELVKDATLGAPRLIPGVLGQSRILSGDYVTGGIATAICLLLLLGACGKSAQFPLHVWLPDAMEGPTPVSALIHAATMVTAGVYMVTRCTPLFMASPDAQLTVSVIGATTALIAGLIALTQYDLKRVLAYSTVSQLGYMFLGLGTGTFVGITAGMFHLFTHAFFKALLFLGSGSVMHAMGHIIDMRRFSGLRKLMPYTHATFFIGCLALAGVFPFAGFWSKDAIVAAVHDKAHALEHSTEHHDAHGHHGDEATKHPEKSNVKSQLPKLDEATALRHARIYQFLYYIALFTAFLTAFYTFRGFFMTFYGEEVIPAEAGHHAHESPPLMIGPLMVLAVCAALIGGAFMYNNLQSNHFADFLGHAPSLAAGAVAETIEPGKFHLDVAAISTVIAVAGILLAMFLYAGDRTEARAAQAMFDLQGMRRFTDVQWVASLKRIGWVASLDRALRNLGLGWLVSLIGLLLGIVALVLSAPLALGTFVTPYRLSLGKFFFDELYTWAIVRPLELIAYILYLLDRYLIDGLVNLCGVIPKALGGLLRTMQTGQVQFYAAAMLLGTVVLLAARVLWANG